MLIYGVDEPHKKYRMKVDEGTQYAIVKVDNN